jgi:Histidine kinase/Histidine kinase-, DNA gyrase B-, and HSP90-like ATPase
MSQDAWMQENRPMTALRRALIGLGVLAFAIGIGGAILALASDHNTVRGANAALVLLIGWGFVGTGLYAWDRRPGNGIGPLMTAAGFSAFLMALRFSNDGLVFTIGGVGSTLFYAVLIHLVLSFPSGRLRTRLERFLVAAAYFDTTVLQLGWVLLTDPVKDGCPECPTNPLLIDNSTVAGVIDATQVFLGVAVLAVVVGVLYRRWRNSTPAQRRTFAPVFGVGGVSFTLLLLNLVVDQAGLAPGLEDPLFYGALTVFACIPFAFLVGLLRSRFSRAEAISSVVGRLGVGGGRGGLRDALAEALGDPGLELAYWVPDRNAYLDADGRMVRVEPAPRGKTATIIEHDGGRVAAILHDADLGNELDLVQAVGAAAALTLENERLDAELRAHVAELRASRARIVEAGYAERRRLERDLHDGAQQRLMGLTMNLRLARNRLDSDPRTSAELLEEALEEVSEATSELRELARGIHPAVLTDRGLEAALTGLAGRATVPVEILETPGDRLPGPVESAAYFVVAEALTNVGRYACADRATIRVAQLNGSVEVEVRDDGVGGANPTQGTGLSGLSDRVAALDGRLEVVSPPGEGTTVRASIPCG